MTDYDVECMHSLGETEMSTAARCKSLGSFEPATSRTVLDQVEALRFEGYELCADKDWDGAIQKYSECVKLALSHMVKYIAGADQTDMRAWPADDVLELNRELKKLRSNAVSAYCSTGLANLQLENFDQALSDSEHALALNPADIESLDCNGAAATALQLFEKALHAFQRARGCATGETPKGARETVTVLTEPNVYKSIVALAQSRSGAYDLTKYFLSGCNAKFTPYCVDFVGPVEIREIDAKRWGLFATRSLEPGELLTVSNPLGVCSREEWLGERTQDIFLTKLLRRMKGSKRQMARVYALAFKDWKGMREGMIPSMDLFRPGSEWIPVWTPAGKRSDEKHREVISKVVGTYQFEYCGDNFWADLYHDRDMVGLWILPAFANHSCAPNCIYSFVGTTMFVRAFGGIKEGEELTLPCFTHAMFRNVAERGASTSRIRWFACDCERCLFEHELNLHLLCADAHKSNLLDVIDRAYARRENFDSSETLDEIGDENWTGASEKRSRVPTFKLVDASQDLEAMIRLSDNYNTLSSKQQAWIRASYIYLYCAVCPGFMSVETLRSAFDAMTSVYITRYTLMVAAWLLYSVDPNSLKYGHLYEDVLAKVLQAYRIYFGRLPDEVLKKLVKFIQKCTIYWFMK